VNEGDEVTEEFHGDRGTVERIDYELSVALVRFAVGGAEWMELESITPVPEWE
jgi:hypothetical protein